MARHGDAFDSAGPCREAIWTVAVGARRSYTRCCTLRRLPNTAIMKMVNPNAIGQMLVRPHAVRALLGLYVGDASLRLGLHTGLGRSANNQHVKSTVHFNL